MLTHRLGRFRSSIPVALTRLLARFPSVSQEPITVVTIEGSATPSQLLPRGQQQTVRLTSVVQALIDRGFVVELDRQSVEPG